MIAIIVIQVEKLDLQIYFLDTQVWYTVMSALVGALEGARMGLGEVSLLFFSHHESCVGHRPVGKNFCVGGI